MIYIDPDNSKIVLARSEYLDKMLPLIFERIDNLGNPIAKNYFDFFINDNLENILIGKPSLLIELNKLYTTHLEINKAIKYVFNYDWFIKKCKKRYDAYNLAEALDFNTCVYCNRIYTFTIITKSNEKITRPQFDHFFDKDSNPLLALSFYNLIPSCSICNSNIKHGKKFELSSHIHPYIDNIINEFNFSYDYTNESKSGLKVVLDVPKNSKIEKTFIDMSLEMVYNAHTEELKDLLNIRSKFSDKYLSILSQNVLGPYKLSQSELYRLAFGTEIEEEDFVKRPFSKFKSDILKELGII